MGFASFVTNELADKAVTGAAYLDKAVSFASRGEMHHHGHVDIVKSADADQFRFAGQKAQFSFGAQAVAVFDFYIFFGRYGKRDYIAV